MKVGCGFVLLALTLLAGSSEAGGFKAPKPIAILKISGKSGDVSTHRAQHPKQYYKPEWGNQWKLTLRIRRPHFPPYIKGY